MLLRFLVLASIVVVLGCAHYERKETPYEKSQREVDGAVQRLEAQRKREVEQHAAQQRQAKLAVEQHLAQIRGSTLPQNYIVQIDASFVRILKDPDSRKIEFRSNPYGSLVCGTVNAKNSFGGYTGMKPFYAYFAPNGQLTALQSDFSLLKMSLDMTRELALERQITKIMAGQPRRSTQQMTNETDLEIEQEMSSNLDYKLLRDCGLPTP